MAEARKENVCAICGCVIEDENKMVMVDGECICEDCAETSLIKCERCGSLHRASAIRKVYTEADSIEEWCLDCLEGGRTFYCDHCDGFFDTDYYNHETVHSGNFEETWCSECADSYAVTCSDCGELIDEDSVTYIRNIDAYVCDDCLNNGEYASCDRCGDYFTYDGMYHDSGDYNHVCRDCARDSSSWYYCSGCDTYVYEDDWDYEMEECYDCLNCRRHSENARVREWGHDPSLVFFGKYAPNKFCGCGIELEVDREDVEGREKQDCLNALDELFGEHAYYKHDGSLNHGFEIVTMPHTIEEFYKLPWEKALAACVSHGFSSHEVGTCGLHMHVSRLMFGEDEEEQSDNIAKLMQFYEMYWVDILRVSRRTDEQAFQWARRYMRVRKETLKDFAKHKEHCDRYMAVNVTNRDTVEIRINRGTLKLKTFLATCDFILTTCQNASKIDWADVSDDFLWLKGLKKETLEYLNDRNAFNEPTWKYLQEIQAAEHDALMAELEERRREAEASMDTGFLVDDDDILAVEDNPFEEIIPSVSADEFSDLVRITLSDVTLDNLFRF